MIIKQISVLVMFGICSWEDIKTKRIHIWWFLCFATEGIICQIFIWKHPALYFFADLCPGAAVLVLSCLSGGSIGTGDSMLLMTTGIFLGAEEVIRIFIFATFISAGYALFLYVIKKKSRTYEIPFAPFILVSYIFSLFIA